ncbi:uncharacterized protein EI90DRAFT_960935 [Cantharellus anzutake]|uniref:uncharacterized protein n=1 Tax=Cantharellus anzutake TaxID=1750568 RepID=UPI0019087D4B|nr:uncharacterized protein EI90DRAFT_960935 [Cantharellus anzutake]KAF8331685.1 hypothetical protein EI90DRAFT_960935 [Cantharellus anzutake]
MFWDISRARRQLLSQHPPGCNQDASPPGFNRQRQNHPLSGPREQPYWGRQDPSLLLGLLIWRRPNMSMSTGGLDQGQLFPPSTNPAEQNLSAPTPGVTANASLTQNQPAKYLPAQQSHPPVLPQSYHHPLYRTQCYLMTRTAKLFKGWRDDW